MDLREQKLAELVVNHCTNINSNDNLLIYGEEEFSRFANLIEAESRKKGADTIISLYNLEEERKIRQTGNLETIAEEKIELAEWCTALVKIDATKNSLYLEGIDPKRLSKYNTIVGVPFMKKVSNKKA